MINIAKARDIKKYNRGITLIALVITIIILLILAGVAIATITGENGLLTKANNAKIATEIADIKEEIQTEILGKQAENEGNISDDTLKEILEKYGVLSKEGENLIDKILTTTNGNYEIKVSDIFNGTTKKDVPLKPYVLAETMGGANSPNISGFNVENTYYVTWGTTAPYQPNETSTINNAPPSGWSNYNGKEWANIKTTGGGNDCYWVWIPRYAYKITSGLNSNTAGTIDIVFLKGQTNKDINGNDVTSSSYVDSKGQTGAYKVHPAFTQIGNGKPMTIKDAENNDIPNPEYVGNGGFGELTGMWVAKYEASSNASNVVENPTVEQLAIDGGSEIDIDLKVRVKPNVTSWRKIAINNMFTVCRNLIETGNSLENTSNLNSHMMKNTEWGAVAYLSRSVYGINSEVWNNPYYNNATNCSPITGLCGNETNGKDNATTDITKTLKYNETGGGNASTTGNVYGVYDMAGGAWEYVAGYLSEITTLVSADQKYKDAYSGTSDDRNTNYNANSGKYGDSLYETSSSGNSITGSWESTYSYFLFSRSPVLTRGGRADFGSNAGVFAFSTSTGEANTYVSFRPVALSSQP